MKKEPHHLAATMRANRTKKRMKLAKEVKEEQSNWSEDNNQNSGGFQLSGNQKKEKVRASGDGEYGNIINRQGTDIMREDEPDKITTPAEKESPIKVMAAENIKIHEIQDPIMRRKDS